MSSVVGALHRPALSQMSPIVIIGSVPHVKMSLLHFGTPRAIFACRTIRNVGANPQLSVGQVAQVVERSPEKAGVGGSTPSLATMFSICYEPSFPALGSNWLQNFPRSKLLNPVRQATQFLNGTLLRLWNKLLINVLRRARVRVAKLCLCVFHVSPGHFQPGRVRCS